MVVTLFCLIIITTSYIHYIHFILFHFFFLCTVGWLTQINYSTFVITIMCVYVKNKNNANILLKLNVYILLTALSVYEAHFDLCCFFNKFQSKIFCLLLQVTHTRTYILSYIILGSSRVFLLLYYCVWPSLSPPPPSSLISWA